MKVIIPSAKLVSSELQNIGKIPAIIYPVNQNISFDFFKLKYDGIVSELDVVCFEGADKIQRSLANYKISTKLNLLMLDKLGDLGYSVYCALKDTDGEVIIHFADTILMDNLLPHEEDFFYFSSERISETWTFYKIQKGELVSVHDKISPQMSFIGNQNKFDFFIGFFKLSDGAHFKKCLETVRQDPAEKIDSFYAALMLYSKTHKLRSLRVKDWFDIGHSQCYFKTRMQVKSRSFNHIDIDQKRGILKKTSENVEKFLGEVKWYLKLPSDVEYVCPRIFDYSLRYDAPYIRMEYYSYHTLHELFLYGDLSYEQWEQIFKNIKFVLDDFSKHRLWDADLNESLNSMYLEKTLSRLNKLKELPKFKKFFEHPVCINGIFYRPLREVESILQDMIPRMLYNVDSFSVIHGDFCFPNIMVDDNFNFIKMIDPRGAFGKYDIYGDRRYEFAKLMHSIEGKYDFIIKDLFSLRLKDENIFNFEILKSARNFDLSEIFLKVFASDLKDSLNEIRLIESLLFFSMVPLHEESLERQYAMLCTAIKLLNELIPIRTEKYD